MGHVLRAACKLSPLTTPLTQSYLSIRLYGIANMPLVGASLHVPLEPLAVLLAVGVAEPWLKSVLICFAPTRLMIGQMRAHGNDRDACRACLGKVSERKANIFGPCGKRSRT